MKGDQKSYQKIGKSYKKFLIFLSFCLLCLIQKNKQNLVRPFQKKYLAFFTHSSWTFCPHTSFQHLAEARSRAREKIVGLLMQVSRIQIIIKEVASTIEDCRRYK